MRRLKKAHYGLKHAPHAWYSRIDEDLINLCFTKIIVDPNLYYLFDKFVLFVLIMYIDDFILRGSFENLIAWCKNLI